MVAELSAAIDAQPSFQGYRRQNGALIAIRDLDRLWPRLHLHCKTAFAWLLRDQLPVREPHFVRALLFDKPAEQSWPLPWHRDQLFPVHPTPAWSGQPPLLHRHGQPHLQADEDLLSEMFTLRFHLDRADEHSGGLWVKPGSQRGQEGGPEHLVAADAGDLLLFHPGLMHRSLANQGAPHRRIVHVEYAWRRWPAPGLAWPNHVAAAGKPWQTGRASPHACTSG